jgi:hypothetical protein
MAWRAASGSNDVTDHYLFNCGFEMSWQTAPQLSNAICAPSQRQTSGEMTAAGPLWPTDLLPAIVLALDCLAIYHTYSIAARFLFLFFIFTASCILLDWALRMGN